MLRPLEVSEIEALAARPGVKKSAVESFLMTVNSNRDRACAILNLANDKKTFRWNDETVRAITDGITASATAKK